MPPINAMQANAGFMPYGTPDMPPLVFPMGAPGATASPGQVSAMLQQQMYAQQYAAPQPSPMWGGTTMQSPFRGGFGGPPSMFGRAAMARQTGIASAGTAMGGIEAGIGVLSTGVAMIPGIGLPLSLGIEAASSATFGAFNAQRERALAMQNQSLGYVFGGGMMSQTGQGMGMQQARMISSGLGRMADSQTFKQETHGMLNRADLDRLTRIAGETGMLNNSTQSPQQVLDAVRKISKQVTTFMTVLEEPDFQKALQRMGQLHQLGVRIGDMGTVAANTRTFARMAGVTADQAMGTAMEHAQAFQARGLSAANGINASLGAQGFGRQIASTMDARTLSMMGGVTGVTNNLMEATTNTFSNPLLMASVLSRGANGRLHASGAELMRNMSGPNASISDIARRGASNMRGLGGRGAIAETLANMNHLRDGLMDELSPEQMMLMNLRMAQLQQRQAGGSLEENVFRMTGGNEEQTRAMMQLVRDPRAMAGIRDQMRIAARDRAVGRRDRQLEHQSHWMQRAWDENVMNPIGHSLGGISESVGRWSARNQERAESLALQGNGRARALDGDNYATSVFTASVNDEIGAILAGRSRGRGGAIFADARRRVAAENRRNAESMWGELAGADGFGFTAAQRGGDSFRQTVLDGGSIQQRFADSLGGSALRLLGAGALVGPRASIEEVNRMAQSQMSLADTIRRGTGTAGERSAVRTEALNALGEGNRAVSSRALNVASEAARSYFGSREGWFGTTHRRDEDGMRNAMITALTSGPEAMSREQAEQFVASQAVRTAVTMNVRNTGSAEAVRQLEAATTQGTSARESMAAQTTAALRSGVAAEREKVRETLGLSGGLFGMGQASDADVGRLSDLLTTTGNEDEDTLRRKLFTAYAMSKSTDSTTARRGNQEVERLLAEGGEHAEELFNSVKRQVDSMDPDTLEDLADSYRGKTVEEAALQTNRAAESLDRAKEGTARIALTDVLGEAGASALGDSGNISRLREHADSVKSRRIRTMLTDGQSTDEQIRRAIQTEANAQRASASSSAGAGEEETGTEEATEGMIDDIQAGLAEFPEATENLATAATELNAAAQALREAAESGAIGAAIHRAG